jgi:hypothetical protein
MKALDMKKWLNSLRDILVVAAVAVSGNLIATGIHGEPLFVHWSPCMASYQWYSLALVCLVFIAATGTLFNIARHRLRFSNLAPQDVIPRPVVVYFLSTLSHKLEFTDSKAKVTQESKDSTITVELTGDLDNDIKALDKISRWNWQQLLRGLRLHRSDLKHVFLIGSKDDSRGRPGSQNSIQQAIKLLKWYFPDVIVTGTETATAVDFEDFRVLTRFMNGVIALYKGKGYREDDIVVDVTGGQKTASIAGAIVTLNSGVQFQYVSTVDPDKCMAFNISYTPPPSP